jgi:hypothetical protein
MNNFLKLLSVLVLIIITASCGTKSGNTTNSQPNILFIFKNEPFSRTKPLFWEWRFHTERPNKPNSWVYLAVRDGDVGSMEKHLTRINYESI